MEYIIIKFNNYFYGYFIYLKIIPQISAHTLQRADRVRGFLLAVLRAEHVPGAVWPSAQPSWPMVCPAATNMLPLSAIFATSRLPLRTGHIGNGRTGPDQRHPLPHLVRGILIILLDLLMESFCLTTAI